MSAGGKLLLLEMVMPERAAPHIGMMIDVQMLVTIGDRDALALNTPTCCPAPASALPG
jgi:hypothetical protein